MAISTGLTIGPTACSSIVAARPSQNWCCSMLEARLSTGGALRPPFLPSTPVETGVGSENPCCGRWQVAQETVSSTDRRVSKNNQRPSRTVAGVGGSGNEPRSSEIPSGGSGSGNSGLASSSVSGVLTAS